MAFDPFNNPRLANLGDLSELWWVSRGKDGTEGPVKERLINLSTEHLLAILKNCPHIRGGIFDMAIRTLLEIHPAQKV